MIKFILIFLFSSNAFALNYFIVKENGSTNNVVVGHSRVPQGVLYRSPIDNDGKQVTLRSDLSLVKVMTIICSGQTDCESKLPDICIDRMDPQLPIDIPNSKGIINAGFTEVNCIQPQFRQTKRDTRIGLEASNKTIRDAAAANRKTNFNALKGQCAASTGLLKRICENARE